MEACHRRSLSSRTRVSAELFFRQGGPQGEIPHHDDAEKGQKAVEQKPQKRGGAEQEENAHQIV